MTRKIAIFDTTLRDGEQSPGCHMSADEKVSVAHQLLRLNVDIIEAGFPVSSPGDFIAVRRIAQLVDDKATVCALSRAVEKDILAAAEALQYAKRPRIQTGIGVSPVHLREKLHMSEDDCKEAARKAIAFARNYTNEVQFYLEDAGRADLSFLASMVELAIASGARIINIPDTTGYSLPEDFGKRIRYLFERVDNIDNACISVHCHNDLGMATALSIAGICAGAGQVECTINGIGERAGNAALEEIVMAMHLHGDALDASCDINTTELQKTSRLVSSITGMLVQSNKAIVGANAFSHASGIHQDGVLKARETYEIINPEEVGAGVSQFVLTARSGRSALRRRLKDLGYDGFDKQTLNTLYARFLETADKKNEVYDDDLLSLIREISREERAIYTLQALQISCGFPLTPTATLTLRDERDGSVQTVCEYGAGPIDAAYRAIDTIVKQHVDLSEFSINALSRGVDALGEVTVRLTADNGTIYTGRGSDNDIIVSSAKAYLNAINSLILDAADATTHL